MAWVSFSRCGWAVASASEASPLPSPTASVALDPDLVVMCYVLNDASVILPLGPGKWKRKAAAKESEQAPERRPPGPGAFGRAIARESSWLSHSLFAEHVRERLRSRERRWSITDQRRNTCRCNEPHGLRLRSDLWPH